MTSGLTVDATELAIAISGIDLTGTYPVLGERLYAELARRAARRAAVTDERLIAILLKLLEAEYPSDWSWGYIAFIAAGVSRDEARLLDKRLPRLATATADTAIRYETGRLAPEADNAG